MKHRKYIPKMDGEKKSSRGKRATAITPGELYDDQILVAEGRVVCPLYDGSVQVWIDADYHGLLDLHVYHDDLPNFASRDDLLVDDPVFAREVVRVLQEAGKLPPGEGFVLHGAECGMQLPHLAVFECLYRGKHRVCRAAALAWGAEDQELAEERERLFGRAVLGD